MQPYIEYLAHLGSGADAASYGVYPRSIHACAGGPVYLADDGERDVLVVVGADLPFSGETGEAAGRRYCIAQLDHETAEALRRLLPFTAPVPVLRRDFTVGVGDRLGIAGRGHIRVFRALGGTPVLAQQSMRELHLTNRTFEDVLDAATFAVLAEGWHEGFGADGDHLKKPEEIEYALSCGYSMITLDCSEHIRGDIDQMTDAQAEDAYVPDRERELIYLNRTFHIGETALTFDRAAFVRMSLIYGGALDFAAAMYERFFRGNDAVDFEISIDETATPTTPLQHFFIANELMRRGVSFATLAPRFCGEFQKGVDYMGDLAQFEREFAVHEAIAAHFGYKLSVHSGSDKFSVFPTVGRLTGCRVHVKTAGTNWLEAMRVVAEKDPALYRAVHRYALSMFGEAKKFYHVTTNIGNIPDVDTLPDAALPALFANNDARQLIHITYGFILGAKDEAGAFLFRDRLYSLWRAARETYYARLEAHIGNHVKKLRGVQ